MEVLYKEKTMESQAVPLTGKLVRLRPLDVRTDLDHVVRWMNDPEVTQFLRPSQPVTRGEEEEWFQSLVKDKERHIVFGVETLEESRFIGVIGTHNIDPRDRTATSGASIGEKEFWGKGYGTDAKMLQLAHAFEVLNLRKVCSSVIAFNERSERYLLRSGYEREGIRARQRFRNGKYWDEILLAVFRHKWLPLWKKYKRELLTK
jgi:RimJ/RimL family protein N-acetyltransferase